MPPTFAAETEVVTVDVLVLDEHGKPVSGLGREDFRVFEDGKLQAVTSFEEVEARLPEPPDATAPPPVPPSASRLVSNTQVPPTRRTFGIVFDDVHLGREVQQVRQPLRAFLAREMRPGDRLVLLSTGSGRFWTTTSGAESPSLAAAALEQMFSRGRAQPGDDLRISPFEAMSIANENRQIRSRQSIGHEKGTGLSPSDNLSADSLASERVNRRQEAAPDQPLAGKPSEEEALTEALAGLEDALAVLRDGIAMLGGQRDRKVLVLVSGGFMMPDPFLPDAARARRLFQEVRDAAARANAVLYFLDARGFATGMEWFSAGNGGVPSGDVAATLLGARQEADGARMLAAETGGLTLQTNDFQGALQRIADESRVAYLLGYEPPGSARDGRHHALKVEVLRPGLTVRARSGYYAPKGVETAGAAADALRHALQDPFDRQEIPLRFATFVLGAAPAEADKGKVEVLVTAELRADVLESRSDEGTGARVLLTAGTRERPAEIGERTLKIPAAPASQASAGERWRPFFARLPLEPGVNRVRILAESGGRIGSVTADVVVPPLGDERLGTPVLSNALSPDGPLPLVPRLRRNFAGADTLHCWVALHGAQGAPDTRTSASFLVRTAGGREWARGSFDTMPGAEKRSEWVVSVPLRAAPEGENELVLSVRDLVSGRTFESREPFRVEPRPVVPAAAAGGAAAETKEGRELAALLQLAGAYVARYGASFRNLVAEEAYQQEQHWVLQRQKPAVQGLVVEGHEGLGLEGGHVENRGFVRKLRSDVVFVPLPGPIPWGTFRDIYAVDGKAVRDHDRRLEKLFAGPSSSAYEQARAILLEGARYNLGGQVRTVNMPTLGLLFLLPQNQGRLSFKRKGEKTIAGFKAVEVAFEEQRRPTLIRDPADNDVTARGRFWIDPVRGTVLQTRLEFKNGSVTTAFRREPALDILVPDTMSEAYRLGGMSELVSAEATYRNYRRFQVKSDWEVTDAKPSEVPAPPPQGK